MEEIIYREVEGKIIVNVTPHPITFGTDDGGTITVPCSGIIVNAKTTERQVGDDKFSLRAQTPYDTSREGIARFFAFPGYHCIHKPF